MTSSVAHLPLRDHPDAAFLPFAERLLNLQCDIWNLEAEQARLAALLRIRRAARQSLARQARQAEEG